MESVILKRFRKIFLLFIGIFENPKHRWIERAYGIFVTAIFIIELVGNYVGFKARDVQVEELVEIIYRLIGHGYCMGVFWLFRYNRDSLLKITSNFCKPYPRFVGCEVTVITGKNFVRNGLGTLVIYSFAMLTFMSMPMVIGILTRLKADDAYIYIFPYWYTCTREDFGYDFLCWRVTGYASYLLKNGTQFVLMFTEQLSLLDSVSICLLFINSFRAHLQVIETRMKELATDIGKLSDIYFKIKGMKDENLVPNVSRKRAKIDVMEKLYKRQEAALETKLIDFIRHHQFLYGEITQIIPILTRILSLLLVFAWSLMLFVLCVVFVEVNGSLMHRVKVGSLIIMTVLVFYLICYLGELMSILNKSALEYLYDIPWYMLPVKHRKIMITQQILLQNRFQIKAFGMILMNMERFAFSMRTMYTALNMLLLTLKKV